MLCSPIPSCSAERVSARTTESTRAAPDGRTWKAGSMKEIVSSRARRINGLDAGALRPDHIRQRPKRTGLPYLSPQRLDHRAIAVCACDLHGHPHALLQITPDRFQSSSFRFGTLQGDRDGTERRTLGHPTPASSMLPTAEPRPQPVTRRRVLEFRSRMRELRHISIRVWLFLIGE